MTYLIGPFELPGMYVPRGWSKITRTPKVLTTYISFHRLLICSMQCIATAPSSQKISSILRFVEIYSSPETYGNNPSDGQISSGLIVTTIYSQLAGRDYFGYARAFCEARYDLFYWFQIQLSTDESRFCILRFSVLSRFSALNAGNRAWSHHRYPISI